MDKLFLVMMGFFALMMCMALPMANIKFSPLVAEIRGKVGEGIVQGWKSGVFMLKKMMTSVRNPSSAYQDIFRSVFSEYSKKWFDLLTADQRAAWETYALTKPGFYAISAGVKELVGSNGGVMSGINAYCLTNAWLISAGLVAVADPPLAATPPSKPENVAATCLAGVITLTWDAPVSMEVGARLRMWIASASNKWHKQRIMNCLAADETNLTVDGIRGAQGKRIPLTALAGELVYIQCDIVNPTGGKSQGSNTVELVIA